MREPVLCCSARSLAHQGGRLSFSWNSSTGLELTSPSFSEGKVPHPIFFPRLGGRWNPRGDFSAHGDLGLVGWLVRAGLLPWFQAAIKGRASSTPGDLWTCRPAGDSYRPLLGKGFCPLSASVTGLCVSCDGFHRGEIPVLSSVQGRRLIIQSSQGCSRSKCSSSRTSSLARGWTKSVVLAVALPGDL